MIGRGSEHCSPHANLSDVFFFLRYEFYDTEEEIVNGMANLGIFVNRIEKLNRKT